MRSLVSARTGLRPRCKLIMFGSFKAVDSSTGNSCRCVADQSRLLWLKAAKRPSADLAWSTAANSLIGTA